MSLSQALNQFAQNLGRYHPGSPNHKVRKNRALSLVARDSFTPQN
jgi:hypothetical protein